VLVCSPSVLGGIHRVKKSIESCHYHCMKSTGENRRFESVCEILTNTRELIMNTENMRNNVKLWRIYMLTFLFTKLVCVTINITIILL